MEPTWRWAVRGEEEEGTNHLAPQFHFFLLMGISTGNFPGTILFVYSLFIHLASLKTASNWKWAAFFVFCSSLSRPLAANAHQHPRSLAKVGLLCIMQKWQSLVGRSMNIFLQNSCAHENALNSEIFLSETIIVSLISNGLSGTWRQQQQSDNSRPFQIILFRISPFFQDIVKEGVVWS